MQSEFKVANFAYLSKMVDNKTVFVILNAVIYDTWDFSLLVELGSKEQDPRMFKTALDASLLSA